MMDDKQLAKQPALIKEIIELDRVLKQSEKMEVVTLEQAKVIYAARLRKRELVNAASKIWGQGKKEGAGPAHA